MEIKRILFVTGTRADFGKLKPLISMVQKDNRFDCSVFVTGMHILKKYGSTIHEVYSAKIKNVFPFINQIGNEDSKMDIILANTVTGLSHYIHEFPQDLIVVHGDRTETLAGAIVGMSNDILVAHIEGGEISGTVDELIRHAVTKLSRVHFVANKEAKKRLIQLGECEGSIFVIGSPDIDLMLSNKLPTLEEVKKRYEIPFDRYAIFLYHPVTTELDELKENIEVVLNALKDSGLSYVLLYPNNDIGSNIILQAYEGLKGNSRFKIYPSMRFSHFLTFFYFL
jgi:UDP-N-acetylglucosamine 2-epimerase (hydrolysing)